jgi:phosphoribosylanthranilate isomerase
MLRKIACAVALLALTLSVASAEQLKGKITKLTDKQVTFQTYDKATKTAGEAKTYDLASDVTVSKMVKKNKEAVSGGLKAEPLQNIPAKGLPATIDVNNGKVTEIILGGGKKKNQ